LNTILKTTTKSVLFSLFLFLVVSTGYSQSTQNGKIIVEINNIENKGGVMIVGAFKETDKFLKVPSSGKEAAIKDESAITLEFENIPYGTYAISIFHDLNENGELDSKIIGIPKEPIGFSNDYFPKFGPPKFKNAAFVLNQEEVKMTINLRTY
jgi:uncharacterized protein (DUF2141 family)